MCKFGKRATSMPWQLLHVQWDNTVVLPAAAVHRQRACHILAPRVRVGGRAAAGSADASVAVQEDVRCVCVCVRIHVSTQNSQPHVSMLPVASKNLSARVVHLVQRVAAQPRCGAHSGPADYAGRQGPGVLGWHVARVQLWRRNVLHTPLVFQTV